MLGPFTSKRDVRFEVFRDGILVNLGPTAFLNENALVVVRVDKVPINNVGSGLIKKPNASLSIALNSVVLDSSVRAFP